MSNQFQKVAAKFQDSFVVIPVILACFLGIAISVAAFISDYKSSYQGYIALPTQKVNEWVWLIALLPQVGQVIFGSMFTISFEKMGRNIKANWLYLGVTFFFLLWDNGTDVWFKTFSGTAPAFVWVIAIVEALVVYTIGSEVLMIASLGLFLYLLPIALKQFGLLMAQLAGTEDEQPRR